MSKVVKVHDAKLAMPVNTPTPRAMGFVDYQVPELFFEPLPEDEFAAWER